MATCCSPPTPGRAPPLFSPILYHFQHTGRYWLKQFYVHHHSVFNLLVEDDPDRILPRGSLRVRYSDTATGLRNSSVINLVFSLKPFDLAVE